MKKHFRSILIWTSGIVFLISILWIIAWLYSPQLVDDRGYRRTDDVSDLIAFLGNEDVPVPIYFHILRFRMQNSEKARISSLQSLRNVGRRNNSFCSYQDFIEISRFRRIRLYYPKDNSETLFREYITLGTNLDSKEDIYQTEKKNCSSFDSSYISVSFNVLFKEKHLVIEELYKKLENGRFELILQAKELRINNP